MNQDRTILVIDDDKYFARFLEDELGEEGYRTKHAANGADAFLILKELKPSLIILDIIMPVMDGMEALGPIVRKYEDVPVILYSSYEEFKKDFKSWAADSYLVKSPDLTELKNEIRRLLVKYKRKRSSHDHTGRM